MQPMQRYSCMPCGTELRRDQDNCPECGSTSRSIAVEVTASINLETELRTQARHGEPGKVKPHSRGYSELLWNHDRQRVERRVMVIDHENDYYLQEWRDRATDEVVWRKDGPLSDPNLHGASARRPREASSERRDADEPRSEGIGRKQRRGQDGPA